MLRESSVNGSAATVVLHARRTWWTEYDLKSSSGFGSNMI